MKIQEFTLQKFIEQIQQKPELAKKHYSEVYQREFNVRDELIVRLEPIEREEVKLWLPDFEKRNFRNSNFGNFMDHPLYFRPDEYFLFGYRTETHEPRSRPISILFRTKTEDKLIDNFLEYRQETAIIKGCCYYPENMYDLANEKLKNAQETSFHDTKHLIEYPKQILIQVPRGIRISYIKGKISYIIETLSEMEKVGYNVPEIIDKIKSIEISPMIQKGDIIWNSVIKNLSLEYQE